MRTKVPELDTHLAERLTTLVQGLRALRLAKVPGIAETLDWAAALVALHASHLDADIVHETLGCTIKDETDLRLVGERLAAGELAGVEAVHG